MNVELLERRDAVEPLRGEWDALAREDARDGFFRTSAWYLAWLEHIRPDSEPFVITVRVDDGRLVGLAPLCRMRHRHLGLTAVGFGGRDVVCGDYLDVLTTGYRPPVLEAVLERLWELRSRWSLLIFGDVITRGDLQAAVEPWARSKGLAIRRPEDLACPYIELPARFEDFLRGLSESMRYHIRRRTRDILEKHGARVEVYTEPDQVAARLDILIRLHVARWRRDGQPGTLGRRGFPDFLRRVTVSPPPGARPRLYVLVHQAQPVAALLAFQFAESALYYQAGWDPDSPLARLSPGVVLVRQSIEDAIGSGLRYYDFLRGDEEYKFRWTRRIRTTSTLLLARTPLARAYLRSATLASRVKRLWIKPRVASGEGSVKPEGKDS